MRPSPLLLCRAASLMAAVVVCIFGVSTGWSETTPRLTLYEGPFGPGGTYVVYEVRGWGGGAGGYGDATEWYQGYLDATARTYGGAPGNLVAIGSAAENAFIRQIVNYDNAWIGYTDDNLVFGGTEFGNTSGQAYPPGGNRGAGWVWVNGEPVAFGENWGSGEPNNSGTSGEDAGVIRADGLWNDNQSNIPGSLQTGDVNYRWVVEYPTNTASPQLPGAPPAIPGVSPGIGTWQVREVINNGNPGDVATARNLLSTIGGGANVVDYTAPVVNIQDSGGQGHVLDDARFGVVNAGYRTYGSVDNMGLVASRRITIPAGQGGRYTFLVNSDDGFELTVRDATSGNIVPFAAKGGDGRTVVTRYGSTAFDFGRGVNDSFGRIDLPSGDYNVELVYWEGGGGSAVELLMARGDYTGYNGNAFILLGAPTPPPAPVLIGPYGPGGEWVAYRRDATAKTFDQARADAGNTTLFGQPGHLVAATTPQEMDFIVARLGAGWLGLTDLTSTSTIDGFNYAALGTVEGGNTSGQPTPINAVPVSGQHGYGYRWLTGEPLTRSRWNNGEPNDSGGNEDAIEIQSPHGVWNDLQAGSTAGQGNSHTRASNIEYNLGVKSLKALIEPGFLVTVHRASDGSIGGDPWWLFDANSIMASSVAPGTVLGSASIPVANLHNNGSNTGNFGSDLPFPGTTIGTAVTQAVSQVTGTLDVAAAGNYVFRTTGDDGARLRIDGMDIIVWNDDGMNTRDSATIALSAGTHSFEWVNFQGTGGWTAELAYRSTANPSYVLVGDASQGISATMTATTYKSVNVDINNLAQARQLADGQLQRELGTPVMGIAPTINMWESGGASGHFFYGWNDSMLGITGDDLVVEAEGWVGIPRAGDWTFGVSSDDGFGLSIAGADLVSATGDNGSTLGPDGQLAYNANRSGDTLGVLTSTSPATTSSTCCIGTVAAADTWSCLPPRARGPPST